MWSVWCRALVGTLLVALGASLEFDDQLPAAEDLLFQDENNFDTGSLEQVPVPRVSDVMMQRLIKNLQMQRMADIGLPNWLHPLPLEDVERIEQRAPETNTFTGSVFKRLANGDGGRVLKPVRPQQKWKTKKGKLLGSHIVCYFKLCAFRSPE